MKNLLKALGIALGMSAFAYAGPVGPPAGSFITNISTMPATQQFTVLTGTITSQFNLPFISSGTCMTTDVTGKVIGQACAGGGVAGADTQIQYNNSGSLGASSQLTFSNGVMTVSTGNATNATFGSPSSVTGPKGSSSFHGAYVTIASSGTTQGLLVESNGVIAGGAQNQIGAVTIRNDANPASPASTLLVLVDSTTDLQTGAGELEIWSLASTHNDPIIWIHRTSANSAPEMRWDSPSPNMEMVATSSDNAHGRGKWEPYATPFQGEILQVNSRAWDNTTFENVAYWEPLSIQPGAASPGLYIRAQDLADDSGVISSSNTGGVHFFTQNNHTVGITGPLNVTSGSWDFRLPNTANNLGQVLYQSNNGDAFAARQWAFTTGGTTGQVLSYNSGGAPTWATVSASGGGVSVYPATAAAQFPFGQLTTGATVQYSGSGTPLSTGLWLNQTNVSGVFYNTIGFETDPTFLASGFHFGQQSGGVVDYQNPLFGLWDTSGNWIGGFTKANGVGVTNGFAVGTNLGVNTLDIAGGAMIGATYTTAGQNHCGISGTDPCGATAPTNGLGVQGNLVTGSATQIAGNAQFQVTGSTTNTYALYVSTAATGAPWSVSIDTNGITSLGVVRNSRNSQNVATYVAVSTDSVILASAPVNTGEIVTLPAASANPGQELTIAKVDTTTNTVTINGAGTDLITGTGTITLNAFMQTWKIMSDGVSNWIPLMAQQTPPILSNNIQASGTSVATSSAIYAQAVYVPVPISVTGFVMGVGVQAGNMDVGIYNSKFQLVTDTGTMTVPGAGLDKILMRPVNLSPGWYYIAFQSNNGVTMTFQRSAANTTNINCLINTANTTFPLPSAPSAGSFSGTSLCQELGFLVAGGTTQ